MKTQENLRKAVAGKLQHSSKEQTLLLNLLIRATEHPKVLEIMADLADCADVENDATHDPEVMGSYNGEPLRAAAAKLRNEAASIRATDSEIWEEVQAAPLQGAQLAAKVGMDYDGTWYITRGRGTKFRASVLDYIINTAVGRV